MFFCGYLFFFVRKLCCGNSQSRHLTIYNIYVLAIFIIDANVFEPLIEIPWIFRRACPCACNIPKQVFSRLLHRDIVSRLLM
ncbi:Hypothetical protein ETEE_3383 [Edwardsiella anguillarum ET080813]|uniref:Uncharacterized protein n=1 Tax=Edwardsiella anguillarum ET080813 TaxID=667120 RepID=A0A076LMS8_9GAMM|nr:Hypothetical protein ETEE_3383 [Edwardsiella anguillarum ET080813]